MQTCTLSRILCSQYNRDSHNERTPECWVTQNPVAATRLQPPADCLVSDLTLSWAQCCKARKMERNLVWRQLNMQADLPTGWHNSDISCKFMVVPCVGYLSLRMGDPRSVARGGVERSAWRHHGRSFGDWEDPSSTKGTILLAWISQWHPGIVHKLSTLCIL